MVDHPVLLRGIGLNLVNPRPTLIERTDGDFVSALLAQMGEGERGLRALERDVITRRDETGALRLFQPIHRTFNIALVDAACDLFGSIAQPRVDPAKIESAGLVVRRLAVDAAGRVLPGVYEGWRSAGAVGRGWVRFTSEADAKADPDPKRRPVFTLGHAALDARLSLLKSTPAQLAEAVSPLFPAPPGACEAMAKTVLFGVVNVTSSEFAVRSPAAEEAAYADTDIAQAVPIYLREGGERVVPLGGQIVQASMADNTSLRPFVLFVRQLAVEFDLFGESAQSQALYDAVDALRLRFADGEQAATGDWLAEAARILVAGENGSIRLPTHWPPISSEQAATLRERVIDALEVRLRLIQPNEGRFDARGRRYVVQAFARVVHHDGCPPELFWSEPSEPFVIAPWYEAGNAPPTLIQVPNAFNKNFLKSLKPNVSFAMPEEMFNFINADLSKILDGAKPSTSGGIGLDWICSLNITIIFIVAFILLFTMLLILNFIFQWMLFIKICIPIPKKT